MAEGAQTVESEAPVTSAPAEVVVTTLVEETPAETGAGPEVEEPPKPHAVVEEPAEAAKDEGEKKKKGGGIPLSVYFKEESNLVEDLEDSERKALDELKRLIQAALAGNEFTRPPPSPPPAPKEEGNPVQKAEQPAPATDKAGEPVAEAPKPEELTPEVPKVDEPPADELKVGDLPVGEPSKVEKDDPKGDDKEVESPKPEESSSPPKEGTALVDVTEKAVAVDEDGAKTVNAIEETVVPVASTAAPPLPAEKLADHPGPVEDEKPPPPPPVEDVSLWGVPLLEGQKSDTVLLKFLRARDFDVKAAVAMLKDTVVWRKEFGIEDLLKEDLRMPELEKVVFMNGHDKEGHPVCYNVYGEFQDKELYNKVFADEEKRGRFLRWRIQFLEKGIRQHLDFSPTGVCSMVQVTDLKNSPGPGKRELRQATNQALALLQDNYPEFVAKQIFINVPWWYMAFNRMISPFLTQRIKSKFVFAGPSRSSETLFEYIAPEQVPVQYGGLSKKDDPDFSASDPVTEFTIKPSSKHTIVIPASEGCLLVWELRVLGWDVSYGAEFLPSAEDAYTVIVQKARRFSSADEAFVKNSFKIGERGKIVLTIDNTASRKKKLLYRCKTSKVAEST